MPTEKELVAERLRKVEDIRKLGMNPYPYRYETTATAREIREKHDRLKPEEERKDVYVVAGRMVGLRRMGKATFMHLYDGSDKIQLYFSQDTLKDYSFLKLLDLGDWLGVRGHVFKTKTGELTIHGSEVTLLGKAIRPMPEKWHGLKDKELRYRKRYLDFIVNPDVKTVFLQRATIIQTVRDFLTKRGFIEVETPVLQPLYGGTNARPFVTHFNVYKQQVYLRVAPELYLKRLVIGGFGKVFELGKNYRNEGVDHAHNPEFTMLEFYEMCADYHVMMDTAEELYKRVARALYGDTKVPRENGVVDLGGTWPRVCMTDAIKEHAHIDVLTMNLPELETFVKKNAIEVRGLPSKGELINAIFEKLVTSHLTGPLWIIDYPKEISPLSKPHRSKEGFVERFECYMGGMELGDGWSEITDAQDQRERFEREQQAMRAGNAEAHPLDEDFIEALEYGMPTLGGIGIGIDRLAMFFTNQSSIRDVLLFPFMKPLEGEHEKHR